MVTDEPAADPTRAVMARRAAALLWVEAGAFVALALSAALSTAEGEQSFVDAAVGLAGTTALGALLLVWLGLAVRRGRGWARTPALVLQLVALPVGTDQVRAEQWATGPALLLLAGATAYHLLAAGPDLR